MDTFKVIIIGGGPTGLAMAHCLSLAGIEYVLFEQRDSITDREGAAISIMPYVFRILHQFGMFDKVREWATPMRSTVHVMGEDIGWRDNGMEIFAEKFGYNVMLFERYQLIKLMLEAIPEYQSRIRTRKSVQLIKQNEDGVSVTFQDGTTEHGSILVGADGVHSKVRRIMSEMCPANVDMDPFTSFTRGIYGHGPRPNSFRSGEIIERHHEGWALQTLTGGDRTYYFVYEKLKVPTKERRRFTKTDAEEFVRPYLDERILGDVTVRQLWERRDVGNLRYLEEGVSHVWSNGRIVLVGDSAHKVTPNLGIGGNIGIESAVCLANHLHALVQQHSNPDATSLSQVFAVYQQQRIDVAKTWHKLASANLRFLLLDAEQHKQVFKKKTPEFGIHGISKLVLTDKYLQFLSQGIKLNYVPLESELNGSYPWADRAVASESSSRSKL